MITATDSRRGLAAELVVLELYDDRRRLFGHDYGNGQRVRELNRRHRELEPCGMIVPPLDAGELYAAYLRVGVPRLARARREQQRYGATSSNVRTIRAWERLARAFADRAYRELQRAGWTGGTEQCINAAFNGEG
jgi:hypothetical protein